MNEETIDHFVDEYGNTIYINAKDRAIYVGLNEEGQLKALNQPTIVYATELPSTQSNANLFEDIMNEVWDE